MKRRLSNLLATVAGALLATPASAEIIWSDEFDYGFVPDAGNWSYDLGDNGWGNLELQDYTRSPDNVRIENGSLVITAREIAGGESKRRFTSGRIRTQDKVTFRYGTVEARIRVPNLADGLWPAFWTLGNNFGEVGWPACGEIDIMEMGNSDSIASDVINRRVGSAAHWLNGESWANFALFLDAPADLDDGFHIFRLDWTPESISTYLDGQKVWSLDIRGDNCSGCSELHQPHFLILNLAVGGRYTGLLSENQITAALPAEMQVDYVRIIDNGHTELGGAAVTGGLSAADQ